MLYKYVKAEDAWEYEGKGHYNCQATRLHTFSDMEGCKLTMGLTHFLPNGGAFIREANFEMIYFCVSGQITIPVSASGKTGEDGEVIAEEEFVMNPGDSVHFAKGAFRGIRVTSKGCADMLVVMIVE